MMESRSPRAARWAAGLRVAVLYCFAVPMPLLDLLARYAEFLVVHGLSGQQIVLLTVGLCLGVPLALAALVYAWLSWRSSTSSHVVSLLVALLLAVAVLPLVGRLPVAGKWAVALSALIAVIGSVLERRTKVVPTFLEILAIALLVVPLKFLASPSASSLLVDAESEVSAEPSIGRPAPVVFVIFDALPLAALLDGQGRIDQQMFPNFARLAADATWYRQATTVASTTQFAVPAILNGRYPDRQRLPTFNHYPENLFSLLAGDFQMTAWESVGDLCPAHWCGARDPAVEDRWSALATDLWVLYRYVILPADLTESLPRIDINWSGFRAPAPQPDARGQWATRWLRTLEPADPQRPSLNFLHVVLPHRPLRLLPSGRTYPFADDDHPGFSGRGRWRDQFWPVLQSQQRHLLQLGYVDRFLGQLLDRLNTLGLYDQALVVITADHGMSFLPGFTRRDAEPASLPEIMTVPLLIKRPGQQQGEVSDLWAETIDIVPTIGEILEVEIPWPVDGQSLVAKPAAPGIKKFYGAGLRIQQEFLVEGSLWPAIQHIADRRRALLGADFTTQGLFAAGPLPQWLGQSSHQLPAHVVADGETVEIVRPVGGVAIVDPNSDLVPVWIAGRLPTPKWWSEGVRLPLLVTVDGVVRASTWSYKSKDGWHYFRAMLPEESFGQGAHRIEAWPVGSVDGSVFADNFESGDLSAWGFDDARSWPGIALDSRRLMTPSPEAFGYRVEIRDITPEESKTGLVSER